MLFGVQQIFQNYAGQLPDSQVWDEEIRLGVLADQLGFDSIWPVEHHFRDYAACPDNLQYLSYMAANTERIGLATGAVILPWNDPLRVVEKLVMLDYMSGGRAFLGLGRGLARREYAGFDVEMGSSRERFDEAAELILDALDTGFFEGKGKHYPRERTEIRPRPLRGFRDRVYSIAMSQDSVESAARIGTGMAIFSQVPWEKMAETMDGYRKSYRETHGCEAPPPLTCDFVVCHQDEARAEELARKHITGYLATVLDHYELKSDHFKGLEGYEMYGSAVDVMREVGLGDMMDAYLDVQAWGTPDRIVNKLNERRGIIGEYNYSACFRFAGIPYQDAERSMRLFAEAVVPAFRN